MVRPVRRRRLPLERIAVVEKKAARTMLCPLTFSSFREVPADCGGGEAFGCMADRCMWWVEITGAGVGFCGGSPYAAERTGYGIWRAADGTVMVAVEPERAADSLRPEP